MTSSSPRAGGAVLGVLMAVAGIAGTWASWRYFVDTATGQRLDAAAFEGSAIGRNTLWRAAEPVLDVVSVPFIVVVLGAAALIAFMRRRWFLALQVTVLVGGANLTTQLLKHGILDRPALASDVGPAGNSLPSGHTTVAASVAAALLLVVPRRARPLVAVLGAGYTALTGVSTMIGGWHRPSDVVAAVTVVLAWAGLTTVLTALGSPERVDDGRSGTAATTAAAALLALAAAGSGAVAVTSLRSTRGLLAESGSVTSRDDLATAYLGAGLGVVATTGLTFAVILVAHQIANARTRAEGVSDTPRTAARA